MTTHGRPRIRVKAMLVAPNEDFSAHVVSVNSPTAENPDGYHRLIGGSVEVGETHRDAIVREVAEDSARPSATSPTSPSSRTFSRSTAPSGTRSSSSTPVASTPRRR